MKQNRKLFVAIITLAGIVVILLFFSIHKTIENNDMKELFSIEKEEMENEYSTFATQYDELQIQINNDSLREQLSAEKLKTQRLLEELRQVKSSNAAEITRLKKELATVRSVLRSYVVQIDSLNRANEALTTENRQVKNAIQVAHRQINTLAQETKTLTERVSLAAQLDATNITISARNKRGKETHRVKDTKRIAVSFTIVKNITAETGNRTLFIRIAQPDNSVLTQGGTFGYENRQLEYSIKKYIEYTGEEQDVTVYWNVAEYLQPGIFHVYIFSENGLIGEQDFRLE